MKNMENKKRRKDEKEEKDDKRRRRRRIDNNINYMDSWVMIIPVLVVGSKILFRWKFTIKE